MRLPLPWKDRTLLCFLSWRTRPRIKKMMSSLVNFSFSTVRRHPTWYDVITFLYVMEKSLFFITDRLRTGDTAKEIVPFAPPRIPDADMAINRMYLLWFEHRAVSHRSVLFSFFFKKIILYRWKTRVGKWMVDFNVIIDSFSDPTTPRERNFFH